jgi:ribonuclease BN (tRNA processing enzyme)
LAIPVILDGDGEPFDPDEHVSALVEAHGFTPLFHCDHSAIGGLRQRLRHCDRIDAVIYLTHYRTDHVLDLTITV